MILLAGGDDGEILVLAEHALSGAQRFQLHAAMRAGASANGVRKVVFTPPRMSALGADVRAVRPLDGVMLEAMAESVCPLYGGQFRQSLAQSCDFLLYGCSRFHNQKLNRLGCCTSCAVALVALLGLLTGFDITLFDILKITIPATLIGVLVGAFASMRVGKELMEDPEYLRRMEEGLLEDKHVELNDVKNMFQARLSVIIFIVATLLIVLFGSIPGLRPSFDGKVMDMPSLIEILMLSAAALILIISRTDGIKATQGSVFPAGMQAVIAIFGIAWMGDTFINGNITELTGSIEGIVRQMPWLFGVALFVMSILLYSQAATVRAIVPLGIALGISPMMLIALFPAVNGYFFIPNYPTVIAAINFDRTGTTGIGKWVLNHSFMMPGLVATIVSIVIGLLLIQIL